MHAGDGADSLEKATDDFVGLRTSLLAAVAGPPGRGQWPAGGSRRGRRDPVALLSVDVSAEGIDRIMWVMNPAKLSPYVESLAG